MFLGPAALASAGISFQETQLSDSTPDTLNFNMIPRRFFYTLNFERQHFIHLVRNGEKILYNKTIIMSTSNQHFKEIKTKFLEEVVQ